MFLLPQCLVSMCHVLNILIAVQFPVSILSVKRHLTSAELALHCKRVTRGTQETQNLVSGLIQSLDGPKGCDTLGVPLFDSERIQDKVSTST